MNTRENREFSNREKQAIRRAFKDREDWIDAETISIDTATGDRCRMGLGRICLYYIEKVMWGQSTREALVVRCDDYDPRDPWEFVIPIEVFTDELKGVRRDMRLRELGV